MVIGQASPPFAALIAESDPATVMSSGLPLKVPVMSAVPFPAVALWVGLLVGRIVVGVPMRVGGGDRKSAGFGVEFGEQLAKQIPQRQTAAPTETRVAVVGFNFAGATLTGSSDAIKT